MMKTRWEISFVLVLILCVQPSGAAEVHVKSLAGAPDEFSANRLPGFEGTSVESNILALDRMEAVKVGGARGSTQNFSVNQGVGFSLVQVTDTYPVFSPSTFHGPNGSEYFFDGVSISCNGGRCGLLQAGLQIERFSRAAGGIAVFSVSGGEVTTSNSWQLEMQPVPDRLVKIDSILSFEDEPVIIGLSTTRPDTSSLTAGGDLLALVEGSAPMLSISYRQPSKADGGLGRVLDLSALGVEVSETRTKAVVHQDTMDLSRILALPTDVKGQRLVPLPVLAKGEYSVRLDIEGEVEGVGKIERTAFYFLPVIEQSYRLTGAVRSEVVDSQRLKIELDVEALGQDSQHVYAYAEVWSWRDNRPVAWIGGMTFPRQDLDGQTTLPLMLDTRWVALAAADGSELSLRNVRIQDPNTFIPMDQRQELILEVGRWPSAASLAASEVIRDDALFEGAGDVSIPIEMPVALGSPPTDSAPEAALLMEPTGLLLVHGWCSSPGWPTMDFPGNTPELIGGTGVFSDVDQSRSHDEFAMLIRDQGEQLFTDAFSVVAHSQGGAAALHLKAFYNSGLDNINAPRAIQTLGTPYKGSNLMDLYLGTGLLGTLIAEIFGLCPPEFSLSTFGSSLWLATVPNSARREVFYFRTHYERPGNIWQALQFWRWRCNVASFIIPGRDDGAVSVSRGGLPYGFGQRTREGECHTDGMKHRDQKENVTRNELMNRLGRPLPGSDDFSVDLVCDATPHTDYPYWTMSCSGNVANGSPPFDYRWRYANGSWISGSSSREFTCLGLGDSIDLRVFDSEGEQTDIEMDQCPLGIP